AFVEYPPDLMDSHATDQCHDNTPAIAENSFATPIGIVKSRPRERDLGGVFVDEDNDQQDE
ncbi:hypothetical protein, partial [Mycobacterium sp.]|uniref:hypothetical protein n=1 Tax=Mycobacterium sp. TaxID=1785 RepID=UPI003C768751